MYQVGDLIVYGGTGVCRVMEVGPHTGGRLYYTLGPVYVAGFLLRLRTPRC